MCGKTRGHSRMRSGKKCFKKGSAAGLEPGAGILLPHLCIAHLLLGIGQVISSQPFSLCLLCLSKAKSPSSRRYYCLCKCFRLLGSNYIYKHPGITIRCIQWKTNKFTENLVYWNSTYFTLFTRESSQWDWRESCIFTYCKPRGEKNAEETSSYIFIKYIYVCKSHSAAFIQSAASSHA